MIRSFFERASVAISTFLAFLYRWIVRYFSSPERSALSVLALCLVLSLVASITDPFAMDRRVLSYVRGYDGAVITEMHKVPRADGLEASVSALIDEYLLGPLSIDLLRSFQRNTRVIIFSITDTATYLELSEDALFDDVVAIAPSKGIELLRSSVSMNFPSLSPLSVSIAGYPYEESLLAISPAGLLVDEASL